jgi:cytochrome c-type biogenesis protein CcmH
MKHSCIFVSGSWSLVSRFSSFVSHLSHFCLLPFAFCLLPFACSPVSVFAVTTQEVEEALTCQCGCGLTVHSCNHLQCGFAVPAKKTIANLVSQGKGKEEITATFTSRYGEKVLSAPTTKGFNLAAWITPFAAVLVGGILIGVISLRWARSQPRTEGPPQPPTTTTNHYRERLKKELESFEG